MELLQGVFKKSGGKIPEAKDGREKYSHVQRMTFCVNSMTVKVARKSLKGEQDLCVLLLAVIHAVRL